MSNWYLTETGKREMMQGKVMRAEWFSSQPEPLEVLILASMLKERDIVSVGPPDA